MAREWTPWALAGALLLLGGCVSHPDPQPAPPGQPAPAPEPPPPPAPSKSVQASKPALPHYKCDNDSGFDVRFVDGSAEIMFASREPETLMRDAGGVTPQQTVYSSTKLKAEFGLGPGGRGAKLHFADPPLEVRCTRD